MSYLVEAIGSANSEKDTGDKSISKSMHSKGSV